MAPMYGGSGFTNSGNWVTSIVTAATLLQMQTSNVTLVTLGKQSVPTVPIRYQTTS